MEICPLWSIEINIVSGRVENNCQRADYWPCELRAPHPKGWGFQ